MKSEITSKKNPYFVFSFKCVDIFLKQHFWCTELTLTLCLKINMHRGICVKMDTFPCQVTEPLEKSACQDTEV